MTDHPDINRVLYSEAKIAEKTQELADRINADYKDAKG
jgi:hypoxanthine-guanine phosphoribosyltransferase